jgi:superfamily I DNA and RNA helicase
LRPILSAEQQRLCHFEMDGKPRLVRGVAGSGKTVVLANWLVRTYLALRSQSPRLWVVFANASLEHLIRQMINDAWERQGQSGSFPHDHIILHYIDRLLSGLEGHRPMPSELRFNYSDRSARLLRQSKPIAPSCDALFLDEAQDLGVFTIQLLSQLVKQRDPADPKSRSINIFYDNAQNVYNRGTPKWTDLGIDVRGRAVVMKESFRSTQPTTEFALNVVVQLVNLEQDPDSREYITRKLILGCDVTVMTRSSTASAPISPIGRSAP